MDCFHISLENLYCGPSLGPSRWDGSKMGHNICFVEKSEKISQKYLQNPPYLWLCSLSSLHESSFSRTQFASGFYDQRDKFLKENKLCLQPIWEGKEIVPSQSVLPRNVFIHLNFLNCFIDLFTFTFIFVIILEQLIYRNINCISLLIDYTYAFR